MDDFGDEMNTAFPVLTSSTLSGTVNTEDDVDAFRVTLFQGQKISVTITPLVGADPLDLIELFLANAEGTLGDFEASLFSGDPTNISFTAPASGDYFIGVTGGFDLSTLAFDTGTYTLGVQYNAAFTDLHGDNESLATLVTANAVFDAKIHNADDFDYFRLDLTAGQQVNFSAVARATGDPLEIIVLTVGEIDGTILSFDGTTDLFQDASLRFTAPETREYYFIVTGSPSASPTAPLAAGDYRVSFDFVEPGQPDLVAEIDLNQVPLLDLGPRVEVTLRNPGTSAVAGATYDIVLSEDAVIDSNDLVLFTSAPLDLLPAGQDTVLERLSIPESVADGTYFLGVIADPGDQIVEAFETNNTAVTTSFSLNRTDPADIVIEGPFTITPSGAELEPGDAVTVTATLRNQGETDTGPFELLLTGSGVARESLNIANLAAGHTQNVTIESKLINLDLLSDILLIADRFDDVVELDDANNTVTAGTVELDGHGDTSSAATTLAPGRQIEGYIGDGGQDTDVFTFDTAPGDVVRIDVRATGVSSAPIPELAFDLQGTGQSGVISGFPFEITNQDVTAQTYFLSVTGDQGVVDFRGAYSLVLEIEPQVFTGTNARDVLSGNDFRNTITALAGDDLITGRGDRDVLYGGEGADRMFGGDARDLLFGGARADDLRGGDGNDFLRGGTFNDLLFGDAGDDTMYGDQGADNILGRIGNDTAFGGDNRDNIAGEAGDDVLYGGADFDTVNGGDGNDLLYGGDFPDQIRGGDGNDTLYGDGSNDLMFGDLGNDTLFGGDGQDNMLGGQGHDTLDGGDDRDKLAGGEGNDTLDGGAGADRLSGEAGDDSILGGSENDLIFAGAGNDTADAGSGKDVVLGRSGNDSIAGGDDDDKLYGEDGDDDLAGGHGIDFLFGGAGFDTAYGGDQRDIIRLGGDADTAFGGAGDDVIRGEGGEDWLAGDQGADFLLGEAGNDNLDGGADDDRVDGGIGHDQIFGGAGNDSLSGNLGNDRLFGGDGNDLVRGGAGNDTLSGGIGNDTLIGESGDDSFIFRPGQDVDTVLGFGDGDTLLIVTSDPETPASPVISQLSANQWQVEAEGNTILVRTNTGESLDQSDILLVSLSEA